MRGEQTFSNGAKAAIEGSPPLARGTGETEGREKQNGGITPACAGNRNAGALWGRKHGDHPRLRGEQVTRLRVWIETLGSPPLARGTGYNEVGAKPAYRITPACAGNSADAAGSSTAKGDHPRLRGEQGLGAHGQSAPDGSPPLARGTVCSASCAPSELGITPACAGNRLKKDLLYLVFYNIVFHFSISFS